MFTLAHLSDIHLALPHVRRRELFSKRILGYVNWHRGRKIVHRREVLDALTHDLNARAPDHVAVTGDLVNLGLQSEYVRALEWLREMGQPDHVTVIPGNHDAYVRTHRDHATAHWAAYMLPNEAGRALFPAPAEGFPFVRRLSDIALIGLSSAIPTLPFVAAGRIGAPQRRRLGEILDRLGVDGLFRVVLIHHPPIPGQTDWRRGLRDDEKVTRLLKNKGAELVLHGHTHDATVEYLDSVSGPIPVVGVPSASAAVEGRKPMGRYNLYSIGRTDEGWYCEMVGRSVTGLTGGVRECERRMLRKH